MPFQFDAFKGPLSHKHKWSDLKTPNVINSDLKIIGTFTVEGAIIQKEGILVQGVLIEDNVIILNNGEAGSGVTLGYSGFEIDRGLFNNVVLRWNEVLDRWEYTMDGLAYYPVGLWSLNGTTAELYNTLSAKITNNLSVTSLGKAVENIVTVDEVTGLFKTQNQTDNAFITDSTLLTALLLETNWTITGYTGTLVGAVEGQHYALGKYTYHYLNGVMFRSLNTAKLIEYRDEYIASDWIKPSGVAAPDVVNYTLGGITTSLNSFDGGSTEERMTASFEIPHDIALNEINASTEYIEVHVHCMPSSNNAGNVEWFFDYAYISFNAAPISQTSLTAITTISANQQYFHKLSSFKDSGAIVRIPVPSSNFNIGDIIVFTLRRTPTGTNDTYADDVILIKVALHVPIDTRGSKTLYSKYS